MTAPNADIDVMAAFDTIAGALTRYAAFLEDQQAAGAPPKFLVYETVDTLRYIAAVTRGDTTPAATP